MAGDLIVMLFHKHTRFYFYFHYRRIFFSAFLQIRPPPAGWSCLALRPAALLTPKGTVFCVPSIRRARMRMRCVCHGADALFLLSERMCHLALHVHRHSQHPLSYVVPCHLCDAFLILLFNPERIFLSLESLNFTVFLNFFNFFCKKCLTLFVWRVIVKSPQGRCITHLKQPNKRRNGAK